MTELPLELYQQITDEVDNQPDLFTLLRVSINFNSAAERRLYNTISLTGQPPPSEAAQKKKLSVFKRICTCPRVAAYVVHLTIEPYCWSLPSSYTPNCFANVFLSVPNLKTLLIWPSYEIRHSFQAHFPFLLRTFEYSGYQVWEQSFAPILKAFLDAQVELEEVLLPDDRNITLMPSALPKLTTVCGGGKFVRTLLPGRPVTRVKILGEDEAFPVSASPIRSLWVYETTDLKWYTSLSPTLTFLVCYVSHHEDEGLMQYLGCFSRLKKLTVYIDTEYWGWTDEEHLALVNPIFASCPSICCVEVYDRGGACESRINNRSMVWMRGSQTSTASLWDEDEWKKI